MTWTYNVTSEKGATKKIVITNLAPREIKGTKVTPRKWDIGGSDSYQLMDTG